MPVSAPPIQVLRRRCATIASYKRFADICFESLTLRQQLRRRPRRRGLLSLFVFPSDPTEKLTSICDVSHEP
jgi:hypothetical protein